MLKMLRQEDKEFAANLNDTWVSEVAQQVKTLSTKPEFNLEFDQRDLHCGRRKLNPQFVL